MARSSLRRPVHNGLQGADAPLTNEARQQYLSASQTRTRQFEETYGLVAVAILIAMVTALTIYAVPALMAERSDADAAGRLTFGRLR